MNILPVSRSVSLAASGDGLPRRVPATLVRPYPPDRLDEVEKTWSPARTEFAAAMNSAGLPLEHGHWDWRRKTGRIEANELVLVAVECEGEVEGLMAVNTAPRLAACTPGELLVYVDYLETAPWNLAAPNHPPRYRGTGLVLIGEAVRISLEAGFGGRLGLHSLPQATEFYQNRCRMMRHGRDEDYYDLELFEYAGDDGANWLASMGDGSDAN